MYSARAVVVSQGAEVVFRVMWFVYLQHNPLDSEDDIRSVFFFHHRTLIVAIPRCCFAENDKEMCQNVKRTCRAIVPLIKTYCSVNFSLPSPGWFRKVPID